MSAATDTAYKELDGDLLELAKLVDPSEVLAAPSAEYADNVETWSAAKNKSPRLVLRPQTVESLSKMVTFLATIDLDYNVRSRGFGSSSATDVLISLSAFDDFEFNEKEKYVILGTGASWRSYYERMDKVTKDWTIVAARTPGIGVGGSTLAGGFSWLSSEFGMISDETNLIDIRIVTVDGHIKWASEDPELLWAMRGTGGGFAIATHFKFRAHHVPENGHIWSGPIMIPRNKVAETARGIVSMVEKDKKGEQSPKTAMYLCVLRKEQLTFTGATEDMLVLQAYDGRGEAAGRKAFKWALDIGGIIDGTRSDMRFVDVAKMQDGADPLRGKNDIFWNPIALTESGEFQLTEAVVTKSLKWWLSMLDEPNSIADSGWLIYELFTCRDSLTGRESNGWLRPAGFKHMCLLRAGCTADSGDEIREKARQYIIKGSEQIMGKPVGEIDIAPNGLEDFHNVERMFGEHFEKLRRVKTRVDPLNRLKGWIEPFSVQVNGAR